ncbi:cytochrome b [Aquisediminimonas profunda]|uniref:cytochrome b n=1 Tax=Aquisediminimonas profunda TaxID=1550733 RepID=UPI001C62C8AA|nr:cytochrome b/b6 domain-containing protein [Aquisediminimonas profunda]
MAILALLLLRVLWRLTHRPPTLHVGMPRLLRLLARATQVGLYGLLLALPLSGWVMSSAVPKRHPIGLAGVIEVPFLPIGPDMGLARCGHSAHVTMAWLMIALLSLHIAGALKHHFYNRDGVLRSILLRRAADR